MSRDSLPVGVWGHRPAEAPSASDLVAQIFDGTGAYYDEIVDTATGGGDHLWKVELLSMLGRPRHVLDLACGTGILTFMIRELFPRASAVGVDITPSLLRIAQARATSRGDGMVRFVHGAAEEVDVPGPFDAVVSCYLPKYADLPRLVSRVSSVLSPGGVLAMQDFTYPESATTRRAWQRRFEALASWARAHRLEARRMFELLPAVIRESDWVTRLPLLLRAGAFEEIRVTRQSGGVSAIVFARKCGDIDGRRGARP